ncbi:MAG TPA: hypothetical protein VE998_00355 [Terriglobales bacterium]|nr:hypothetical protein [Terriglobales bacterium]
MPTLRSGDVAVWSGIYRIPHLSEHGRYHDVIVRRGDTTPDCPVCGANMTFDLVRSVPQLSEDPDFSDSDV